jgi:hypothetical protein
MRAASRLGIGGVANRITDPGPRSPNEFLTVTVTVTKG